MQIHNLKMILMNLRKRKREDNLESSFFFTKGTKDLKMWSHITCQLNIPAVLMRYFLGCSVERGFISLDCAIPSGHRYKCFKAYEGISRYRNEVTGTCDCKYYLSLGTETHPPFLLDEIL